MINYADYKFYKEIYRGSISNDLFDSLIPKASREIDEVVNKELKEVDITDKVRFVACELVDFLKVNELCNCNIKQKISSISIDGVSKHFVNNTKSKEELDDEKKKILNGLPQELTRLL